MKRELFSEPFPSDLSLKKKDLDFTVFRDLKILLQVISFLSNVRLIEVSNISLSGKCYQQPKILLMKGEVKQEYYFVGEVKFTKARRCHQNNNHYNFFCYCRATSSVIDHHAKDGGPGEACSSCSFYPMILCSSNFSIW